MIFRSVSVFSKGGSKFDPLLQMKQSYCSNQPAPKNIFLGRVIPSPAPKIAYFQGRMKGWPASKNDIFRDEGATRLWKCIFMGGYVTSLCKQLFLAAKSRGGCDIRP
jgi:hypothetical protein